MYKNNYFPWLNQSLFSSKLQINEKSHKLIGTIKGKNLISELTSIDYTKLNIEYRDNIKKLKYSVDFHKSSLYTTNSAMNNKSTNSNTAMLTTTSLQSPALTVLELASPTTYSTVGQPIRYIYTVTNSGNVNTTGPINIIDSRINGLISIYNNDLAPGQSVTGKSNYSITQGDINSGSVTISVYAKILMVANNNIISNKDITKLIAARHPSG